VNDLASWRRIDGNWRNQERGGGCNLMSITTHTKDPPHQPDHPTFGDQKLGEMYDRRCAGGALVDLQICVDATEFMGGRQLGSASIVWVGLTRPRTPTVSQPSVRRSHSTLECFEGRGKAVRRLSCVVILMSMGSYKSSGICRYGGEYLTRTKEASTLSPGSVSRDGGHEQRHQIGNALSSYPGER